MRTPTILTRCVTVALAAVVLVGCQSNPKTDAPASDADLMRRAQIVAAKNLELKKNIELLEAKLTAQERLLAGLSDELKTAQQAAADWKNRHDQKEADLTAALLDCQTALNRSQQFSDNASQQTPCQEVETKYAELHGRLLEMLADCQNKLDALNSGQEQTAEQP